MQRNQLGATQDEACLREANESELTCVSGESDLTQAVQRP